MGKPDESGGSRTVARQPLARWILATAFGLLLGFVLFLSAQYLLGLALGDLAIGTTSDEFNDTIQEATGESGFWQDIALPALQGLCMMAGPALLQSFVINQFSERIRPAKWVGGAALGGAIGGLALASLGNITRDGMIDFNFGLSWEFMKLASGLAFVPSVIAFMMLKPRPVGVRYFIANVIGWGLGIGAGVSVVVWVVVAQSFDQQLESLFLALVGTGAIVAGAIQGAFTGLALRTNAK